MNRTFINLGALAVIALGGSALATAGNAQEPVVPGDSDAVTAECTSKDGVVVRGDVCTSSGGECKCA